MKKNIFLLKMIFLLFLFSGCQAPIEKEQGVLSKPSVSVAELQEVNTAPAEPINLNKSAAPLLDFREPAKKVTPGVVHIISTYKGKTVPRGEYEVPDLFKDFFGDDFRQFFDQPHQNQTPRMGSGSGVIITEDGYLLTNNHVVNNADNIKIILNDNRSYEAKVIGTDPATDLALLKVDEHKLDFIQLGNSDELEVGEWVLAVGNPFNLSTTVTAGIVSAKARNINIIQDRSPIESFIQTDAAVNPGNSGGALVNLKGELIGINTAIASPTGTYAGYSFAIPVNIARKVVDDLLNYGQVQRAYLGVYIRDVNSKIAKDLNLESAMGVLVDSIILESAADEAGLKKKDVVIKIDDEKVETSPRLQEIISSHRPGEKITITFIRKGKEKKVEVILKGKEGQMAVTKKEQNEILKDLGIVIEDITDAERKDWNINGGVKVTKTYPGVIRKKTDMEEGFIILKMNKQAVLSEADFLAMLETAEGGVMLEGVYPKDLSMHYYYAFGLNTNNETEWN